MSYYNFWIIKEKLLGVLVLLTSEANASFDSTDYKAISTDRLTWTQVSDLKCFNSKTIKLYNVYAIPQNFLIGPDGRIIDHNIIGLDLENRLKEIFKKQ
jgi:hypothetical protein